MDEVKTSRPFGVKFIAFFFLLEAIALLLAALVGHMYPAFRLAANMFISQRVPLLQAFAIVDFGVKLAPLFALINFLEGAGVWFMKKWARTFILWDTMNRLIGGACAAAVLWAIDRQTLSSIVSAPHFLPGVAVNIFIAGYLFDPDVKRLFGVKQAEPEDWWAGGPL